MQGSAKETDRNIGLLREGTFSYGYGNFDYKNLLKGRHKEMRLLLAERQSDTKR
jgi:hypothetical protein